MLERPAPLTFDAPDRHFGQTMTIFGVGGWRSLVRQLFLTFFFFFFLRQDLGRYVSYFLLGKICFLHELPVSIA